MPSGRTNNFPESGHGLGHVTPTFFGSTVGYPSDSLASCIIITQSQKMYMLLFTIYYLISCFTRTALTTVSSSSSYSRQYVFLNNPFSKYVRI